MTTPNLPPLPERVTIPPVVTELAPGYLGIRMQRVNGVSALTGLPIVFIGPVFVAAPEATKGNGG